MKWFKHPADFSQKPEFQILLDHHGPAAGFAFWRMIENLTQNFNPEADVFIFSKRKLFDSMFPSCTDRTGKKIMDYFKACGWIDYKIYGKEVVISCPLLRQWADEYTRKILSKK